MNFRTRLLNWDETCFERINRYQSKRWCAGFFRGVSFLADGYGYLMVSLYLYLSFQSVLWCSTLLAFCFDLPVFVVLKKFFKRPRPFTRLQDSLLAFVPADEFSMPSGHAAAAALFAWQIAHYYPEFWLVAFCWPLLVGLSRVVLGVHYPLDILGGYFLGAVSSFLALGLSAGWWLL